MTILRAFRLALSFLTRFPVGQLGPISDRDWRWITAGFPFCGYVLGLLAIAAPARILQPAGAPTLYVLLTSCLCVCLLAYVTRGLHLDGIADMCDAYGGGYDRGRRLEILKDPCVGSFGVLGLVLVLAIKTVGLAMILGEGQAISAAAVVVLSRFSLGVLTAIGSYARPDGTAARTVGNVAPAALILGGVMTLPCMLVPGLILCVPAMGLTVFLVKRQADRALGGVTGDILGAGCELCETVGTVVMALQISPL